MFSIGSLDNLFLLAPGFSLREDSLSIEVESGKQHMQIEREFLQPMHDQQHKLVLISLTDNQKKEAILAKKGYELTYQQDSFWLTAPVLRTQNI